MEKNFKDLGLSEPLVLALSKQGITTPTEIQENLIPLLKEGKDLIGRSETGSGKTLSYLLPIIEKMDFSVRGAQAIILTPTHELAAQVCKQAELLEENSGLDIGCMLVIGSAGIMRQMDKLKAKPKLIVGSTGRILDLIGRKKIPAHLVKTIVLDEGDRLMEDGNFDDVKAIVRTTLKERQIVLLSASVPEETRNRVATIMKEDYIAIEAKTGGIVPRGIAHFYMLTTQRDKFVELRKILAGEKPKRAIVFLNNPENIEVTVDKLCHHGIQAAGIYGQANKIDRKNAMDDFRAGRISVLVASDIGARGLDIEGVTHIINIDVPEEPTHYLHRAGRCGRKGEEGTAITLVTPYERRWVHKYAKVWGLQFIQKEMSYGKLVDSKKTKNDLDTPNPNKKKAVKYTTIYEESYNLDDLVIETGTSVKREKSPKPQPKKGGKPKKKEENIGFFAKKAKKLEEKEKNRQQNQKK